MVAKEIRKQSSQHNVPSWLNEIAKDGPCCPLVEVFPSKRINGYRNKVSFTIAKDKDNKPCIGFRLGRFAGLTRVNSYGDNHRGNRISGG